MSDRPHPPAACVRLPVMLCHQVAACWAFQDVGCPGQDCKARQASGRGGSKVTVGRRGQLDLCGKREPGNSVAVGG